MKPETLKTISALFAMMGSDNKQEADTAKQKLEAKLKEIHKTWNDLPELLQLYEETQHQKKPTSDPRDEADLSTHPYDSYTPAVTVCGIIEKYVALEPHEYVAAALWVVHTHVYEQFMVTPRLLLTSPTWDCGKTTLLMIIERLAARTTRCDAITVAGLSNILDATHGTLLLDEADNYEISLKALLRAVLNAGHLQGGTRIHMSQGRVKRLRLFAPVALAGIGSFSSRPLLSRSIVINMNRKSADIVLQRYDKKHTTDLDIVYQHIKHWLRNAKLNNEPEMPVELTNRQADNWRPLISIADACGGNWPQRARQAALVFTAGNRNDEHIAIILLRHIRLIFNARHIDQIRSQDLTTSLLELDEADTTWTEYRGLSGSEPSRKLTQGSLAIILRPFGVRPKQLWPSPRTATSKSYRGYLRADFETAWQSYCDTRTTSSQKNLSKKTSARRKPSLKSSRSRSRRSTKSSRRQRRA